MNLFSFLWGTRIRVVPPPQSIYLIFGQKELFLSDIGREAAAGRRGRGTRQLLLAVFISAVKQSIGSTTGFHNHGEGPYYGLLLVESAY